MAQATALLPLLHEPEMRFYALEKLSEIVDVYWPEIAGALTTIETIYEDPSFSSPELAAHVASKIYYHLDELQEALQYALGSGARFDISQDSDQYVQALINKCIDQYINSRAKEDPALQTEQQPDQRLVAVVERMLNRCIEEREYVQAIGIAIEARRLDVIERAIFEAGVDPGLLAYILKLSTTVVLTKSFRTELLRALVDLYKKQTTPNYIQMCTCLEFLDDHQSVAAILISLLHQRNCDDVLIAYQVAFDLSENQNQPFLLRVSADIPNSDKSSPADASVHTVANTAAMSSSSEVSSELPVHESDNYTDRVQRLKKILNGEIPVSLYLNFLFSQNKTDLNILKTIKDKLEPRNSVIHNATVISHAIMHAGTTVDSFLRDNLEWLSRATNWAKFTATASIGVIHKGHHKESMKLLQPYLPASSGGSGTSPYQEGGALYALGLIHGQHGSQKLSYLLEALRSAGDNEIVQHGACLGIGLCGMASNNCDVFEALKVVVMSESAVAGEAAGYALGMVMLGSNDAVAVEEMLAYAHETQHEKTIRGLSMGIAFVAYAQEEQADGLIGQLLADKDAIIRYGGAYAIAMAYCGTSNNRAIEKLLHIAVTDVEDDVRRSAVTALGFVLANQPDQVPRVVQLLAESYNPHVRYGACMAVGIACAGGPPSAREKALDVLEPLINDRVDFVRQAAFIANAMVLIEHNEASEPKLDALRKNIMDTMDVKADTMTKFGAILAAGVVDAGGRNTTLSLLSPAGHRKQAAVVGTAMFLQFWYWYPLTHFISLALSPTAVIGLNKDLAVPKSFSLICASPASLFAYPKPLETKVEDKKKAVVRATLSVTAKQKLKQKKRDDESSMQIESTTLDTAAKSSTTDEDQSNLSTMRTADSVQSVLPAENAKAAPVCALNEPDFHVLQNMTRVTIPQLNYLRLADNQRYIPVTSRLSGIMLLRDTAPGEKEELLIDEKSGTTAGAASAAGDGISTTRQQSASTSNPSTELQPPPAFDFEE